MRIRWSTYALSAAAGLTLVLSGCQATADDQAQTSRPVSTVIVTETASNPPTTAADNSDDTGTDDGSNGTGQPTVAPDNGDPGAPAVTRSRPRDTPQATTTTTRSAAATVVGDWQRHDSSLTLNADGTGSVLMGSGAADTEKWALTWSSTGNGASGTLGAQLSKTGAGVGGLATGTSFTARLGKDANGTTIMFTSGFGDTGSDLTWCSLKYGSSHNCGA